MILKLKFIFIMNGFLMNHADGRRSPGRATGLPLVPALAVLALAFVLGTAAGWAPVQVASASTQTTAFPSPDAPDSNDPPEPPSAANAEPHAMLSHFKDTRFWLSGQAN